MAEEHHIPVLKEVWCDNRPAWRFKESPQLDFLEQNLYRYNGKIWKMILRTFRSSGEKSGRRDGICVQLH